MTDARADILARIRAAFPSMDARAAAAEADFVGRHGIDIYSRAEGTLPARLAECPDAPTALFGMGRCRLDGPRNVAVVGTRRATAAGVAFCRRFVADLAERCPEAVIVSGLAYGIDIAAHRAALDAGIGTVAVVAHGLDTIYPAEHRDVARRMVAGGTGAIVTEYPSEARVHRSNFLARNRIVAGLSSAVVVVESASHGGALYTARLAGRYGRDLFAVPGRWSDTASAGCNSLIASGSARLITSADELMTHMRWSAATTAAPAPPPALDFTALEGTARAIVDYLRLHPDHTQADLVSSLGLPAGEVSARLTELEMDDVLSILPGGRFALNF